MAVKPIRALRGRWLRVLCRLRSYLGRRSSAQRLRIVLIATLIFALLDVLVVVRSMRRATPEMLHIQPLELRTYDKDTTDTTP